MITSGSPGTFGVTKEAMGSTLTPAAQGELVVRHEVLAREHQVLIDERLDPLVVAPEPGLRLALDRT